MGSIRLIADGSHGCDQFQMTGLNRDRYSEKACVQKIEFVVEVDEKPKIKVTYIRNKPITDPDYGDENVKPYGIYTTTFYIGSAKLSCTLPDIEKCEPNDPALLSDCPGCQGEMTLFHLEDGTVACSTCFYDGEKESTEVHEEVKEAAIDFFRKVMNDR